MKKNLILSVLVMISLMLMVVGSVGGADDTISTYKITQTGLANNYEVETLVEISGTQSDINSRVESAIDGKTPIEVTLSTLVEGDSGYAHVRINPINAGEHIQLWAKDTENNWYDINAVGWGPLEGFPLAIDYHKTTPVYLISDQVGWYTLNVELVDVDDSNEVITSNSEEVHVRRGSPTDGNGETPTQDSKAYRLIKKGISNKGILHAPGLQKPIPNENFAGGKAKKK